MSTINYTLKDELLYAKDGDEVKAQFVELSAPKAKFIHLTSIVEDVFFEAMGSMPEGTKAKAEGVEIKDETIDGEAVLDMIHLAKGVESARVYMAVKELFRHVAVLDGERPMTLPLIDELSIKDLRGMVAAYLENFILKSSLEKLQKM